MIHFCHLDHLQFSLDRDVYLMAHDIPFLLKHPSEIRFMIWPEECPKRIVAIQSNVRHATLSFRVEAETGSIL